MKIRLEVRAGSALLIGALAFCSAACGSDDNGFSGNYNTQTSNPQGTRPGASLPTGYRGMGALSNGLIGNLALTVGSDAVTTGTLTVVDPGLSARLSEQIYPVSGTTDSNTSVFSVTGSGGDLGAFNISGMLPDEEAPSIYVITTAGGQTFSGILRTGLLDSDAAAHSRIINGGQVLNFQFNPLNGYNGVNPPIGNTPVFGGVYTTGSFNSNTLLIALTQPGTAPGNYRLLNVGVNTHGNPIKLGTYPLVTSSSADGAFFNLTDMTGPNINAAWAPSSRSSGSITLNMITSTQAEMDYNFQNVGPNTRTPGGAQGSFNVSGRVHVTFGP